MALRKLRLMSGEFIPEIGYGTYLIKGEDCYNGVLTALKSGYRHIDTASFYGNEEEVGRAIKDSGIDRKKLFITTKVWNTSRGYTNAIASLDESLKKLDLDYVDLLLIHWPANEKQFPNQSDAINLDTWKGLIKCYKDGKAKSIGVSNFLKHHLLNLMENSEIAPMVNQIELHPGLIDDDFLSFMNENNIIIEAWSPLGRGDLLNNEVVLDLANKYNKSPVHILIRFIIDIGVIPLVKSKTPSRIEENLNYTDFKLSTEDIKRLKKVVTGKKYKNPDEIDF